MKQTKKSTIFVTHQIHTRSFSMNKFDDFRINKYRYQKYFSLFSDFMMKNHLKKWESCRVIINLPDFRRGQCYNENFEMCFYTLNMLNFFILLLYSFDNYNLTLCNMQNRVPSWYRLSSAAIILRQDTIRNRIQGVWHAYK